MTATETRPSFFLMTAFVLTAAAIVGVLASPLVHVAYAVIA